MAEKRSKDSYQRKIQYDIAYNAEHTTRLYIAFNNKTDRDIIVYLQGISNKQGFIKELLRSKMTEENFYTDYDPETGLI